MASGACDKFEFPKERDELFLNSNLRQVHVPVVRTPKLAASVMFPVS